MGEACWKRVGNVRLPRITWRVVRLIVPRRVKRLLALYSALGFIWGSGGLLDLGLGCFPTDVVQANGKVHL